ncbi:MAG: hypothetical protein U0Z70_15355 [Thermomicrobiales bacterium]
MVQHTVRRAGAGLHAETHGPVDGAPVLRLHGGIGSAADWGVQIPALVAAGREVAMDCHARAFRTG